VSGCVLQKTAVQSTKIMPEEKLLDVAYLSMIWVIADIYEYELPFAQGRRHRYRGYVRRS
jgi:hypothetical protein